MLGQVQWSLVFWLGLQVKDNDDGDHDVISSLFRTHLVRDKTALGCRTKGIHQWYVSIQKYRIWDIALVFIECPNQNCPGVYLFVLKVERGRLHHKLALCCYHRTQNSGLCWGFAFSANKRGDQLKISNLKVAREQRLEVNTGSLPRCEKCCQPKITCLNLILVQATLQSHIL